MLASDFNRFFPFSDKPFSDKLLDVCAVGVEFKFQVLNFVLFFSDLPDFAAFKHARVHNVGTHEGGLHSLHLLSQQLVGQGLVEAHRRKLTGAVILAH